MNPHTLPRAGSPEHFQDRKKDDMQRAYPCPGTVGFARSVAPTARTGEHCPLSGWWTDAGRGSDPSTVYVAEGGLMPARGGQATIWVVARTSG